MDKSEILKFKLEKLGIEASNVKCLAKILEELLHNGDNLTQKDICTLSLILSRTSCALVKSLDKILLSL